MDLDLDSSFVIFFYWVGFFCRVLEMRRKERSMRSKFTSSKANRERCQMW